MGNIAQYIEALYLSIHRTFYYNILAGFKTEYQVELLVFIITVLSTIMTIRLKFINITHLWQSMKLSFSTNQANDDSKQNVAQLSPLQSLFTTLGGSAGMGNISGIIVGFIIGGPGVIFWIPLMPILLSPMRFAEVTLSHKYRIRDEESGEFRGSPSIYLKRGMTAMNLPKIGAIFASISIFLAISSTWLGSVPIQINQVTKLLASVELPFLHGHTILISFAISAIVTYILINGLAGVSNIMSKMAPLVVILYFISCVIILIYNYQNIIPATTIIIDNAFKLKSIYGGIVTVLSVSLCRMLTATDICNVSAAVINASATDTNSARVAIRSMASPVIQGFVVCFVGIFAIFVAIYNNYDVNESAIIIASNAFKTVSPNFYLLLVIIAIVMGLNVTLANGYVAVSSLTSLLNLGKIGKYIVLLIFFFFCFIAGNIKDLRTIIYIIEISVLPLILLHIIGCTILSHDIINEFDNYRRDAKK